MNLFDLRCAQIFSYKKFYSLIKMGNIFLKGKWVDLGLASCARNLNRLWQKRNRTFLRVIELLKPRKRAKISIDYREETILGR